ncbi:MAG: hypothetical protein QOC80_2026, partial [Frankiaceae bacterium]|nr:hypothetical protein [Frankiaceae bacterium]
RTGETWDVRDEKAEQLARAGK